MARSASTTNAKNVSGNTSQEAVLPINGALNNGALNNGALNNGALNNGALNNGALNNGALIIGKPGPFQIIDAVGCSSQDAPVAAPRRRYSCPNYDACLNLAVALDWDNFTCRGCSGEIEETLNWRARQATRKDLLAHVLCEGPGMGAQNNAACLDAALAGTAENHPIPLIETGILESATGVLSPLCLNSIRLQSASPLSPATSSEDQTREEEIYFELYEQMQGDACKSGEPLDGSAKTLDAEPCAGPCSVPTNFPEPQIPNTRLLKMAGR